MRACTRGRTASTCSPAGSPLLSLQLPTTFAGLDDDAYVFVNNLMDLLDTFDPEVPQLLGNGLYGFGPSSNPHSGQTARWPMPCNLLLGLRNRSYTKVQGLTPRSNTPHLCSAILVKVRGHLLLKVVTHFLVQQCMRSLCRACIL